MHRTCRCWPRSGSRSWAAAGRPPPATRTDPRLTPNPGPGRVGAWARRRASRSRRCRRNRCRSGVRPGGTLPSPRRPRRQLADPRARPDRRAIRLSASARGAVSTPKTSRRPCVRTIPSPRRSRRQPSRPSTKPTTSPWPIQSSRRGEPDGPRPPPMRPTYGSNRWTRTRASRCAWRSWATPSSWRRPNCRRPNSRRPDVRRPRWERSRRLARTRASPCAWRS